MTITTWFTGRLARLGDTLAERFASRRHLAVRHLAETVDSGGPDGFSCLFCREADALARLFATYGFRDRAVSLILWHSPEDEPGESHGHIRDREPAETYVRHLMNQPEAPHRDAAQMDAELAGPRAVRSHGDARGLERQEPVAAPRRDTGEEPMAASDCS